jgi:hypothetical protein
MALLYFEDALELILNNFQQFLLVEQFERCW